MELSKKDIRLLLHFQKNMKFNASEASQNLNMIYGDKTCTVRTAQRWYATFSSESYRVVDKPRSGRPKEIDCHQLVATANADPTKSSAKIANEHNCSYGTVVRALHKAGN